MALGTVLYFALPAGAADAPPPPSDAAGASSFTGGDTTDPTDTTGAAAQADDRISPAIFRLGFSFVVGFAIAFAARTFLKISLFAVGLFLLALFGLEYVEIITVNWDKMKEHVRLGVELVESIRPLGRAARIVEQHHERWDGTGYPRGLAGEQLLLEARILAVVDAFDAMTTDRPYRAALSFKQAREELRRYAGRWWDPEVVEAFLALWEGGRQ